MSLADLEKWRTAVYSSSRVQNLRWSSKERINLTIQVTFGYSGWLVNGCPECTGNSQFRCFKFALNVIDRRKRNVVQVAMTRLATGPNTIRPFEEDRLIEAFVGQFE